MIVLNRKDSCFMLFYRMGVNYLLCASFSAYVSVSVSEFLVDAVVPSFLVRRGTGLRVLSMNEIR